MDQKYNLQEFIDAPTKHSVLTALVERVKMRRKECSMTQRQLSSRSGVSYASIRRFETMGEISLSSLMQIAQALDCIEGFNELFRKKRIADLKEYEG